MKIQIDSTKKLRQINEEFNTFFPFLSLEFFENNQFKNALLPDGIETGRFYESIEPGTLTLFPEMSVADLELLLWERFQIPVKVLRKSGSVWLKTVHSNMWSLEQQNRAGEILSTYLDNQHNTSDQ